MIFLNSMKMGICLELCHESLLCTHWQSSHHSYEEDVPNRVFDCSLLSSCDHQYIGNTTYPTVTNAGTRICQPDPFKRRPCSACSRRRRFCHGRCPYNNSPGARCLFGVCTASPYREEPGSTCSQLAFEAEEDECSGLCQDISTEAGAASCQHCLTNIIDPSCQQQSGADCCHDRLHQPGRCPQLQYMYLHPPLLLVINWGSLQVMPEPAPACFTLPAPPALSPGLGLLGRIIIKLQGVQPGKTMEVCKQFLSKWRRRLGSTKKYLNYPSSA